MTITTGLLIDHAEALEPLVSLLEREWSDWYRPGSASARAELEGRMQRNHLPLGIVAFEDGIVAGTCALTLSSGGLEIEHTPWVGGLIVEPSHRRRGVAMALLARARAEARRLGHDHIYALTAEAVALFEHQRWNLLDVLSVGGKAHRIFVSTT